MVDAMVTGFAQAQFGPQAAEVVRGVVEALSEAQAAGCRAQRASGMGARFPYGSVWRAKYDLLVEYLRDLPGAEVVRVFPTSYELVRVAGHEIIPFKLASSLADVPDRPRLTSDVLVALASEKVPAPAPQLTLFDFEDDVSGPDEQIDQADEADEADEEEAGGADRDELEVQGEGSAPVFVGFVGNAESDVLLALRWGRARSISEGVLEWDPEPLPVQLAPSPRSAPRALPDPSAAAVTLSFDAGEVPDLAVQPRTSTLPPHDMPAHDLAAPGTEDHVATGTGGPAADETLDAGQGDGARDERADDTDD